MQFLQIFKETENEVIKLAFAVDVCFDVVILTKDQNNNVPIFFALFLFH